MPNLLHHVYSSPLDDLCPRRLALLLMILAVGCHVDLSQRGPESPDAEKYHHLARAALCEIPVMEETNVETVTALFYEIWYLLVFSDDKKAAGYAWGLMGLTAKLAQSVRYLFLYQYFFDFSSGVNIRSVFVRDSQSSSRALSYHLPSPRSQRRQVKNYSRRGRKTSVLVLGAHVPRCSSGRSSSFHTTLPSSPNIFHRVSLSLLAAHHHFS